MSPSPEPVAPSPEQEMATMALRLYAFALKGYAVMDAIEVLEAWRTRLYLAAKIEGIQAIAADECDRCASGEQAIARGIDWCHPTPGDPNYDFVDCDATPAVHDLLAKLGEEAK